MSPTTSKNNNSVGAAITTTALETTITETSTTTNQSARAMASATRIMSYQNCIALLALLLCGLATVDGLKCHMCGQYNEGVGSITPCLNYSEQYAHLYLKECSKKSEKYCVKYVSELSTVRDCATECVEKEVWETQTFCCDQDGCNGANELQISKFILLLCLPIICMVYSSIGSVFKVRR